MTTTPRPADMVPIEALEGRLEPFLLKRLDRAAPGFALREMVPGPSWNRLDVVIKRMYLEAAFELDSRFGREIYEAHIRAFSLGDMSEPGNARKTELGHFEAQFEALCRDFAAGGFDAGTSLVPLAADGTILNGAHRTACAMFRGQPVTAVETGLEPVCYDYRFFRSRGLEDAYLEAAVQRYVEISPDAKVALLWPAAPAADDRVEAVIGPLVYKKPVRLGMNGAHNLMSQVYANEPWLGAAAENYPGIDRKMVPCFSGSRPLRVLVFDAPPGRDLVAMKDRIRSLFDLGKHSIHITDTHEEAVDLAHLLLNPNSVHFLEHARPTRFAEARDMAEAFRAHLAEHGIPAGMAAVDSGMVLGAYGIRAPNDVDFLSARPLPDSGLFEWHAPKHYGLAIGDLLQDPARHFHYWGLKFISLDLVAQMKQRRNAGRDMEDLQAILPLLEGQEKGRRLRAMRYRLRFAYSRLRRLGIRLLDRVGLKEPVRRLYRATRRRR